MFQLVSTIKSINDIFVNANEIIKSVQLSQDNDPICEISISENKSETMNLNEFMGKSPSNSSKVVRMLEIEPKNVISGSKAVTTFLELLTEGYIFAFFVLVFILSKVEEETLATACL